MVNYQQKYSLNKSEQEQKSERVQSALNKFYIEAGAKIDELRDKYNHSNYGEDFVRNVYQWRDGCAMWILNNIGESAKAKFLEETGSLKEELAGKGLWSRISAMQGNLEYLITNWKNYVNR